MPHEGILESVPNFSEGSDVELVTKIERAASEASVLDVHFDPDHNRSVITLAERRAALVRGLMGALEMAVRSIDLSTHRGVHPRIGAADVVPFIPVMGTSMEEAVDAAVSCAESISEDLGVPVFLYGSAARSRGAKELPSLRKTAFQTLFPDFGGTEPHPTAGACAVGARDVLVAYNVNLRADLEAANAIAEEVRERDGGLPNVRAMGVFLESKRLAQVSMNLTKPEETTIAEVFDAVTNAAAARGIEIAEAELVGLAPKAALDGRQPGEVGLRAPPKILEDELARLFEA